MIFWVACSSEYDNLSSNEKQKLSIELSILQDTIDKSSNNQTIKIYSEKYYNLVKKYDQFLPKAYLNLGNSYWLVSDYWKAIENFNLSLKLANINKDSSNIIDANIYLGLIYERLNDIDKSEQFIKKAYETALKFSNNFLKSSATWNMAMIYHKKEIKDKALMYANQSMEYVKKTEFQSDYLKHFAYGLSYFYLSYANTLLENYELALKYCDSSIYHNKLIDNLNILVPTYSNISIIKFYQKDFSGSIKISSYCINEAKKIHNIEYQSWEYETMYKCFKNLGIVDSSLHYLELANLAKDSLKMLDVRILATKQELSNKEIELNQQSKQNRINIFVGLTIFVFFIILAYLLYSRYKIKDKLNKDLAELNATKDKFFSIISHDLRTPLNSFNDLIKLLYLYYDEFSKDEIKGHISTLKNSSDNLLLLVENLLIWSNMQSKGIEAFPEYFNVNEIIELEINNLKVFSEKKNIRIENNVNENIEIFADKQMISTVIRNLLSNSIKFSNNDSIIKFSNNEKDEICEFIIEDNGIGIKNEDKTKVFKLDSKFSTLGTSNEKGTGLGLCLCKEFIEKNNGKIWFESEYNVGTKFTFSLPIN